MLFKFCGIQSTVLCGLSHYIKRDRRLQVQFQEAIKAAQIFKQSLCRPVEFILLHIIRLSLINILPKESKIVHQEKMKWY